MTALSECLNRLQPRPDIIRISDSPVTGKMSSKYSLEGVEIRKSWIPPTKLFSRDWCSRPQVTVTISSPLCILIAVFSTEQNSGKTFWQSDRLSVSGDHVSCLDSLYSTVYVGGWGETDPCPSLASCVQTPRHTQHINTRGSSSGHSAALLWIQSPVFPGSGSLLPCSHQIAVYILENRQMSIVYFCPVRPCPQQQFSRRWKQ